MQAILKFNLPEDSTEFQDALDGSKAKIILFELREQLQRWWRGKEDHGFKTPDEAIEGIRQILIDSIIDENINID